MKLSYNETYLLQLIRKDKCSDGWTEVSKEVLPLVEKLPSQLCELRATEDGGFAKLTHDGEIVLNWVW